MTREHVIPAFLYAFQKELDPAVIGWNERAGKMVGGEFKIKDVCASCNNGILSELDSYGKEILVQTGILTANYTKLNLLLPYEYDRLVRWLLKISYNSSRTDGKQSQFLENFIPYILGKKPPLPRQKIAIFAYLAGPTIPHKGEIHFGKYLREAEQSRRLNPFLVRISHGLIIGSKNYTLRLVIFGALVFFILCFNEEVLPGHAAVAVRQFLNKIPGAIEIKSNRRFVELHAGRISWMELHEHQTNRVIAKQREKSINSKS